ncbi:hypothetical protein J6590_088422 [Homalodisca vitripennis]|nr:hypothetical protein J6590_088422 [Homalodisca vitripennis]
MFFFGSPRQVDNFSFPSILKNEEEGEEGKGRKEEINWDPDDSHRTGAVRRAVRLDTSKSVEKTIKWPKPEERKKRRR